MRAFWITVLLMLGAQFAMGQASPLSQTYVAGQPFSSIDKDLIEVRITTRIGQNGNGLRVNFGQFCNDNGNTRRSRECFDLMDAKGEPFLFINHMQALNAIAQEGWVLVGTFSKQENPRIPELFTYYMFRRK